MERVSDIMDGAMGLPRAERSYLARKLIESLDQDSELSPEWMDEIEKRVTRRAAGDSQSVSQASVHADIEKLISR